MRWSIRYQFLVPLGLMLLGLVGICTWTAMDSARLARQRIAGQINGNIVTLANASFPLHSHVLGLMRGLSGGEYLLVDASGERVATFSGEVGRLPPAEASTSAPAEPTLGERILVDDTTYLCRGVKLKQPPNAGATLYILYPESSLDEAIWQAVRPSLVLGVSGGLAALVLTLVGTQRLVRRISDLERRTRLIAGGDFSPMPVPRQHDELRDLAESVNEMAGKLAKFQEAAARSERERLLGQVSGGLAHQLRNAVTGAKLAVQLHAGSCAGGDGEALVVAERQLSRMDTDLQRFFNLGRTDKRERCSMGDLIDEATKLLRPQCQHAHTGLKWERPSEEFIVSGESGQLAHLIMNLLGNAVEAAGSGGTVEAKLSERDSKCIVDVFDSGPGPPAGVASRLFEPFVTGKTEGIGLGLSVAKQVAEAHGGSIGWARENGRTCFWVELPLQR